jgi:replicative DNA helicase
MISLGCPKNLVDTEVLLGKVALEHTICGDPQDADVVIFIHRAEMYQKEDSEGRSNEGLAEVIVGKHRNGPTGTIELHFHKAFTRFDNRTEREAPA